MDICYLLKLYHQKLLINLHKHELERTPSFIYLGGKIPGTIRFLIICVKFSLSARTLICIYQVNPRFSSFLIIIWNNIATNKIHLSNNFLDCEITSNPATTAEEEWKFLHQLIDRYNRTFRWIQLLLFSFADECLQPDSCATTICR